MMKIMQSIPYRTLTTPSQQWLYDWFRYTESEVRQIISLYRVTEASDAYSCLLNVDWQQKMLNRTPAKQQDNNLH